MSPTIAECLEHARQCEWYAARTNDEQDRKYLLRKAKHWTKLATKKELEIRASARAAAAEAFPEDHSRSEGSAHRGGAICSRRSHRLAAKAAW